MELSCANAMNFHRVLPGAHRAEKPTQCKCAVGSAASRLWHWHLAVQKGAVQ